jgi:hypothetical protein
MLIALIAAVIAALVGRLRGGSFERLAGTHFRWPLLLWAGLVIQVGLDVWEPDWLTQGWALAALLGTNLLVAAFLAVNSRLPGMTLAAIGMLSNVIVIAANGAMPVSRSAAEAIGANFRDLGVKHEILTDATRLPWLADIIPVPGINALISVGDVILALGIAWFVYRRMVSGEALVARRSAASG